MTIRMRLTIAVLFLRRRDKPWRSCKCVGQGNLHASGIWFFPSKGLRKVELSELGKHLGIFDFPALAEEQTDEVFPQHEENTSQNEAEHKTMKEEIEKLKSQAETK